MTGKALTRRLLAALALSALFSIPGSLGAAGPEAPEALPALLARAEGGDAQAMFQAGRRYETGQSAPRNLSRALEWYRKAADLGLPEAFHSLGACYEVGLGTEVDAELALANYKKAAELKLPASAYKLAALHLNNALIPPQPGLAVDYLHQAVANGHAEAANELGVIYLQGMLDQPRDLDRAFEMFAKSAELGNPEAMKNVAVIYRGGLGRPPDPVQALRWYLTARAAGYQNPGFDDLLAEVRRDLQPADIKRAEEEAEKWLAEVRAPKP